MSPLARLLFALAAVALLQGACAHRRSNRRSNRRAHRASEDASISLGSINGNDIAYLPQIHIGVPDVIITIPNDCDPYGYTRKDLLGSEVIVRNSNGYGPPPVLVAADLDDPQSDVEVQCQEETDDDGNVVKCPEGLDVSVLQFCQIRPQ